MATYGHYSDHQDPYNTQAYNPYDNAQPHQSYDQGGYNDQAAGYGAGYRDDPGASNVDVPANKEERERSVFEDSPTAASRGMERK